MILQSIELVNFGLYKDTHIVTLLPSREKPITLIGGLNGRGKTTLLDAITLGLYGRRALKYLQDERIKYSTYLKNHINKSALYGSTTSVTISLADSEEATDVISICRSWEKPIKYEPEETLVVTRNGIIDSNLSENWDYYIEEILPLSISRFFFFDNEKIAQIADDESFDSVKDSIRSLLGLTTIDLLISDMNKLAKRSLEHSEDARSKDILSEISSLQNRIEQLDQEAKDAYDEAAHYQNLIQKTRNQLEEKTESFWKAGGNLGLERAKLESELQETERFIHSLHDQATTSVSDSSMPLLLCPVLLKSIAEQETANEQRKIHTLSAGVITHLQEMLSSIPGYSEKFILEANQFLNMAKEQYVIEPDDKGAYKLSEEASLLLQELLLSARKKLADNNTLLKNHYEAKETTIRIESHLSREVNDHEAQEIWNQILELNESISQYEVNKRLADEHRAQIEKERDAIVNQRNRLISENLQLQKGYGESERLVNYSHLVTKVMDRYKELITEKRIHDLSEYILNCFQSMVGKESMIQKVQIDPKSLDIKLIDYSDGELLKSQLSAGEKQLFAISIIWGLAKCSGYNMPVVIDTPLGRLDSNHRAHFVERYLPYASQQVVVLSTDEEIYGQYYDLLKPYINATYTLNYDEETKSSSIQKGYFGGEQI